mgnify:CR=1 FL=1
MNDRKESIKAALIQAFPIAISIAATGLSYGVLATQANLSLLEILGMSLLIFSGSVQFITVAMLSAGGSLLSILITTVLFNLRNILYGVALSKGLAPAKKWRWLLYGGISDEPYVLSSARFKKVGPDPLFFGVVIGTFYIALNSSVLIGALIGNQVDPQKWGLDLAFTVTFAALLMPNLKGKPALATAVAALIIAFSLEYFLPGNEFTIVITGILAPFVGLYLQRGPGIQ